MYKNNYLKTIAFLSSLISTASISAQTLALPLNHDSPSGSHVALEFPPSPEREAPQSTAGGGRRGGNCVGGDKQLMALMPNRNNQAKTLSARPSFFIYVPPTTAKYAQFIMVNEEGKDVEVQEIALERVPGIIEINLSPDTELQVGKKYQWQFALICRPLVINKENSTMGTIERVQLDPNLQSQLNEASKPLAEAQIYARESIWNETLSLIASLRSSQPEQWQELLESVGLEEFAGEPIVTEK